MNHTQKLRKRIVTNPFEPAEQTSPGPHIVVAEDDSHLRSLLSRRLRKLGYLVTECSNGVDLLHELGDIFDDHSKKADVDLVISDIRMPGLLGLEVLEGLQESDARIPFILITAFGSDDTHAEAMRLGANMVFDKPFDVDTLIAQVGSLV